MLKLGFFDSINGDREYNARDISELFTGIILDGVFMYVGDHFVVSPKSKQENKPSMWITVGTGMAWFNHTKVYNTTAMEFEVPQAITSEGKHAIILEIDEAERDGKIALMHDYDPSKIVNDEFVHQYVIAIITVPIGTIDITMGNIDNRVGIDLPYVKGPNDYLDDDEIMKHWDATWQEFFNQSKSDWNTFSENSNNTFEQNLIAWQKKIDDSISSQVGRMDEMLAADQQSFESFMTTSDQTFESKLDSQKKEYEEFMADAQNTLNDAKEIVKAGVGGVRYQGSISFEDLPSGDAVKEGYLFNITNNFTTDERFVEGPGLKFVAGTDVCYTKDGKWNIFSVSDNMYIQLPLKVEDGGTGAKNGEDGYTNLTNDISYYNAELTDEEVLVIHKKNDEESFKPRKITFGSFWNWIKIKLSLMTLPDLNSVKKNKESGKLVDALALKESDAKHGNIIDWIADPESGEITGYKTDIGGADTVFPFSNGDNNYEIPEIVLRGNDGVAYYPLKNIKHISFDAVSHSSGALNGYYVDEDNNETQILQVANGNNKNIDLNLDKEYKYIKFKSSGNDRGGKITNFIASDTEK